MIPDEVIRDIRERTDLVALVGGFVRLRKQGASHKGLCPFHPEKTPSFYVHPARGFYHCFGCGASGDAFAFLMRLEGKAFPEVARDLAERVGVEIPEDDPRDRSERQQAKARERRLVDLMDAAAGFFVKQLTAHPLAGAAREELETRGVSRDVVERFRLGYAPHGWDGLVRHLADKGWSPAEAETVGLLVPRRTGSGHYDRFRHRLMFPVADVHGRIVAFSGRALPPPPEDGPPRDPPAKYVNSPESPLYRKGDVLFGLHEGRVAVRRHGWAVVCEGNFDVLALHDAGLGNAVAPLGTALTEAQARLLRRFAERAVLLFDGDRAGAKAVRAAYPVLARVGLAAQVATLPAGDDPDSYLREHGPDALRARVEGAVGAVEHLIDRAASDAGADAHAKAEAIATLGPVLALVDNPVEGRLLVERVARRFGVSDIDAVRRQLRRGLRAAREGRAPSADGGPQGRPREAAPPRPVRPRPPPALEAELVGALLDQPTLFDLDEARKLEQVLTSPGLRSMFHAAAKMVESGRPVDGSSLLDAAGSADGDVADAAGLRAWLVDRLAVQKYDLESARRALTDGIPRLVQRGLEMRRTALGERILAARRAGNDELAEELTRERDHWFGMARELGAGLRAPTRGDAVGAHGTVSSDTASDGTAPNGTAPSGTAPNGGDA